MILAVRSCRSFYRGASKAGSGKFVLDARVSRETVGFQVAETFVSRETPAQEMNEEILLSYTKIPKNHIQDIFDIDPSQQLS
jgi:hypothetical protein